MTDGLTQLQAKLDSLDPHELWAALRSKLITTRDGFPYEAMGHALLAQERLAPLWVEELEAFAADHSLVQSDDDILHFHLIVMLAARHDTRAFKPLLALCELDEDEAEELFGDFTTSVMARALAAVSDGSTEPLLALADKPDVSVWLRSAGLHALTVRALEGDADRAETAELLLQWGEREATRLKAHPGEDIEVLNSAVCDLLDLCHIDAEPHIAKWFEDELVDPRLHGNLAAIGKYLRRDFAAVATELRERGELYIRDAAAELDGWVMFSADEQDDDDDDYIPSPHYSDYDTPYELPYVREMPKVGRNDPCPCGSGKKHKKCCGA